MKCYLKMFWLIWYSINFHNIKEKSVIFNYFSFPIGDGATLRDNSTFLFCFRLIQNKINMWSCISVPCKMSVLCVPASCFNSAHAHASSPPPNNVPPTTTPPRPNPERFTTRPGKTNTYNALFIAATGLCALGK